MADIETIEIKGGESASVSVETSSSVSAVVSPQASYALDIIAPSGTSVEVSIASPSVEVSSNPGVVTTVSEKFNQIEVSAAIPAVGIFRLRDLQDIKGDPESGQVLVYNQGENNFQFQDQQEGSAGGDDLLDSAIEVTNTDGAFSSIKGSTFETGTSITTVLSQILNPHSYLTPSLSNLKGSVEGASSTFSSNQVVEVGADIIMNNVSYTIDKESQVKAGSVALLKNDVVFQSNLPDTSSTNVSVNEFASSRVTPGKDTFKIRVTDSGSGSSAEKTVFSSGISFDWRYSTRLSAYSTIPSNNGQATLLYSASTDTSFQNDPGSSSFDLTCSSAHDNPENYTFIMIPSSFGTLKSVVQNSSTDVTDDFVQVGDSTFTATNVYGVGVSYYIYRTNDPGVFNSSATLTIKLN